MNKLYTVLLFLLVFQLNAQHKIGVRAGLNVSKITGGELELGESYTTSNGFHFGVNYTYSILPNLGVRAEILYVQRGTTYNFVDTVDGVHNIIRPISESPFVDIGKKQEIIDISNGYLSIPLTVQFQISSKFEVFGGLSLDLLLNPTGRGSLDFENDDFFFLQSYDFRYRGDEAGEVPFRVGNQTVSIDIEEEQKLLWRTQSAYYKLTDSQKVGNKFNFLDAHLLFGFNYFLNKGFYLGIRGHYGLTDVTNNEMDFSAREITQAGDVFEYITRDDKDRSISASVSFGFRF